MDQEMEKGLSLVEKTIEKLGVKSVFGDPIREGAETLIPIASVMYGFGFGAGFAQGEKKEETPESKAGGSGGGGGGQSRPVGYIRVGKGDPQFVATFDPSKIAVLGILLSGWSVFWITKTVRAFVKKR